MDRDWWKVHLDEVNESFIGERFSNNTHTGNYRTTKITQPCYANSGIGAIVTAIEGGAKKVILLGYDCQKTNGQAHWHGDHPKQLGNANRIDAWVHKFAEFSEKNKHIQIFNASRQTALTCFQRVDLDEAIDNASNVC
jgi:hypothetical protein